MSSVKGSSAVPESGLSPVWLFDFSFSPGALDTLGFGNKTIQLSANTSLGA